MINNYEQNKFMRQQSSKACKLYKIILEYLVFQISLL